MITSRTIVCAGVAMMGCGGGDRSGDGLGTATAELTLVPVDVQCIVFQVQSLAPPNGSLTFDFDVAPAKSSTFRLDGLPLGEQLFSAAGYAVPCDAAATVTPAWISDPVQATVVTGAPVRVALAMRAVAGNGGATVIVDFPALPPSGVVTIFLPPVFSRIGGIAAGPDGNVWFTKQPSGEIGFITPDGAVTTFALSPKPTYLNGITAGPNGYLWFAQGGSNAIGAVRTDGTRVMTIATRDMPSSIAVGRDGDVWFTAGSDRIGRVTPGGVLSEYVTPTSRSGPAGIAAGADGNMWFAERSANQIARITRDGAITEYAIPTAGSEPHGVAAGADGNIWFTELAKAQIGRVATDGTITELPIPPGAAAYPGAWGIAAGPDGNLWYTRPSSFRVGRITPAGVVSELSAAVFPTWMAAGSDGNVWFAAGLPDALARITP